MDLNESKESKHYYLAINALNKAVSDTEKFGALFVVINVLKDKQLNCEQNIKLFESIGSQFLCRLLVSNGESGQIPDGCKPYIYQSIGVSIITSFYMTIADNMDTKTSLKLLTSMASILSELKNNHNLDEVEIQMINDIIICFECFFSSKAIERIENQLMIDLFESKFAQILLEMHSNDLLNAQKISISNLFTRIGTCIEWSALDSKSFNGFMTGIAMEFKAKHNKHKFELSQQLDTFLKMNTNYCIKHDINEWLSLITDGLFDIFQSRLNKDLRDPALKLTATLTEMFNGFNWISNKNWSERSAKLFLLLLRLSCIEIAVNFDSENIDMCCVSYCFVIIEHSVITIANDSEDLNLIKFLTQEQLYDMLTAVKDTMSVIIEYLRSFATQTIETDSETDVFNSILASIRVLCVWATEETEALREEIADILPFIIKILRITHENNKSFTDCIICALITFVENDKLKSILLRENIVEILDSFCDHNRESLVTALKQLLIS